MSVKTTQPNQAYAGNEGYADDIIKTGIKQKHYTVTCSISDPQNLGWVGHFIGHGLWWKGSGGRPLAKDAAVILAFLSLILGSQDS